MLSQVFNKMIRAGVPLVALATLIGCSNSGSISAGSSTGSGGQSASMPVSVRAYSVGIEGNLAETSDVAITGEASVGSGCSLANVTEENPPKFSIIGSNNVGEEVKKLKEKYPPMILKLKSLKKIKKCWKHWRY